MFKHDLNQFVEFLFHETNLKGISKNLSVIASDREAISIFR